MTPQQLPSLLDVFAHPATDGSYLVVSRTDPPLPLEQLFPGNSSVEWLCQVHTADDMVAVSLADLGVVFDQLEHMKKQDGVRLLGRLCDHHCRRVLLHCTDKVHLKSALLALGFIKQEWPSDDGRLYLFDPDP
ncbi:MAG: DUF6231 family protein [Woeseia sp.]